MNSPLTLIGTTNASEHARLDQEDQVIEEALLILERRVFSRGPELTSPGVVAEYLKVLLAQEEHEVFGVVFLDTKHRVLAFEVLFHGSIDGASVYPRQVVKRALAHNAGAVILCHNHPSGCTVPSQADRTLTLRLKEALALVEVRVLDHFIVGAGRPTSLAENGWL
ncbi:DNA repair protein RadC [Pseudomonas sp. GD03721]|nr:MULTISPECIES: DNA repair protein RadC [unclassified Pseudomonas]MDH1440369.1 DNA repair protein RadC [Pseudomonas sp. GD03722]WGG03541.1 DNA repair protein RadC [Pseudomonas sp. GD03721]WGG07709.1 DNA repair protein RadC [Pseudomonas sp. GD03919]